MTISCYDSRHAEIMKNSSQLASSLDEFYYADSNEKIILREKLRQILADNFYQEAIDLGAGPGLVAEVLQERADHLTLVEIMPNYFSELKNKFPKAKVKIESILDFHFDKKYDLILLSHVLYYISTDEWEKILKKIYFNLQPGGKFILTLAPCHRVHQIFQHKLSSQSTIAYLDESSFHKLLNRVGPYTQDYYLSHSFHNDQLNDDFLKKFVETFFGISVDRFDLKNEYEELSTLFKTCNNKLQIEYFNYVYVFEK